MTNYNFVPEFTTRSLHKVGIKLYNFGNGSYFLECKDCGKGWAPMLKSGGKLPDEYWICPNECNEDLPKI